jgi:hypothetical protein
MLSFLYGICNLKKQAYKQMVDYLKREREPEGGLGDRRG